MNEQTQFKIDTSGYVLMPEGGDYQNVALRFEMLSPFQQGAVEAALREFNDANPSWLDKNNRLGFRHLSPSALQRIMAECERFRIMRNWADTLAAGSYFHTTRRNRFDTWNADMREELCALFPPLTISLAEDGLIHLSEVG